MGFLLFAARKIQLKREINSKQYELTVMTSQYNAAQKRVKDFQEQMGNLKNMTSVFASGMNQQGVSQAYAAAAQNSELSENARAAARKLAQGDVSAMYDASLSEEDRKALQYISHVGSQAGSSLASAFTNISNSIFEAANKVELAKLTAQENSLELRKSSLESELSLLNGEYEAVKGQEKEAMQDAIPHFGLA